MIDALLQNIADWVMWLASEIYRQLQAMFNSLQTWINTSFQAIFDWFENILQSIADVALRIWTAFEEQMTGVINAIKLFIDNIWSDLRTAIETIVSDIISWFTRIGQSVIDLIESGMRAVASLADRIIDVLKYYTDGIMLGIERLYNDILLRIDAGINALIGGAAALIESIETRLTQLKEAFSEAATSIITGLGDLTEEHLNPLIKQIKDFIGGVFEDGDKADATQFIAEVKQLSSEKASPEQYKQFLDNYWTVAAPEKGLAAIVFFAILRIAGSVLLFGQLSNVQAQVYMQEFNKTFPHAIFTPSDVTHLWRRGLVNEEFAIDTIRRQGYDSENAKRVLQLSDQVPQEGDLLHQWHRGLLSEDTVNAALYQKGYSDDYRNSMKTASFLIPPITDLITMAVREAFSPEIAERFGQYEDYPPALTEWSEKQALSEEWSKRYWAAHWSLPSPYQGFEMLHRGIINKEDLDLLLRALDVMPFWRDRLVQIAYTPFTRVDIRRMHKVGVLSEEDVLRSYKDIGYSEDKARLMTDFVLLLNKPGKADDPELTGSLTRGNIIGFYIDGLLIRDKAYSLLIEMGYSETASNLYLDSADLDEERKLRKGEIDLILSLAKAGILDFPQAEDRLNRLGLETREITKAIADLVRQRQMTTRLPSRAEAEKMMKTGAISVKEYKDLLEIFGYAPKWQDAFLKIAGKA